METAREAIDLMADKEFDVIFLDHDLGGEVYVDTAEKNTGSEVVRWMCNDTLLQRQQPLIVIHSMNHHAARDMELKLADKFDAVDRVPFTQLLGMLPDPSFFSRL